MAKVAIVGSRTFTDQAVVQAVVQALPAGTIIVSGGASGPDRWAEQAAIKAGLKTEIYLPDWEAHGKAAGPIRNKLIVGACDYLVAFWDGRSKGTANSIYLARSQGKPVYFWKNGELLKMSSLQD